MALIRAMAKGAQVLEDNIFALVVDRGIEVAVGVNLDQWGSLVGEARDGLEDIDYRRFIRARILVNRSKGTTDEMIVLYRLLMGTEDVRHTNLQPATFKLEAVRQTLLDDAIAARVLRMMTEAAPSGRQMLLVEAVTGYFGFRTNSAARGYNVGLFGRSLA
jgi:hypothetical protein